MATIRERVRKRDSKVSYHVQVRIAGFSTRTETFTSRRTAEFLVKRR